jgi:hypothetical protein
MSDDRTLRLRLTIEDPVPGVLYSLQDRASRPALARVAGDGPLSFDLTVRVAAGPRFLGEFVRREGPTRRFVYLAVGTQAGDAASCWSRRAKIDIHDLPAELLTLAANGAVLEARLPGRAGDGGPACATVRPIGGWRAIVAPDSALEHLP